MNILLEIFGNMIAESVNVSSVTDSIKNKYRVTINYEGDPAHGIAPGIRTIEVYAHGLTTSGNPVIRAYQPYGDTVTKVPSWKFFRLDRIKSWKPTYSLITKPAAGFNPNGDRSMSEVYTIANFSDASAKPNIRTPRTKPNIIGKLDNIDDILKTREKEKNTNKWNQRTISSPIIKPVKVVEPDIIGGTQNNQQNIPEPKVDGVESKDDVFKPDGELSQLEKIKDLNRRIDQSRKIDLSTGIKGNNQQNIPEPKVDGVESKDDVFKPDGELSQLEKIKDLNRRIDQSRKIDLSTIPKR